MNQPVNVYGTTEYYERGELESVFDGFGYRDEGGNITWYDGYNPPKDDDFYITTIIPYGNGCDLSEITTNCKDKLLKYMQNPPSPTSARNRMGCCESWYDSFYAIKETFTIREIEAMNVAEVSRLIRLAENIAENLY